MKETIIQNILEYLPSVLNIIIAVIVGYVTDKCGKYVNSEVKKSVITDTVKYIEQIFTDIHGEEKLNKAKEKAIELLKEKNIGISDSELVVLIESAINKMNFETNTINDFLKLTEKEMEKIE